MPEQKDGVGIKESVHIVLTGPDGKVKDERKLGEPTRKTEVRHETDKRPKVS